MIRTKLIEAKVFTHISGRGSDSHPASRLKEYEDIFESGYSAITSGIPISKYLARARFTWDSELPQEDEAEQLGEAESSDGETSWGMDLGRVWKQRTPFCPLSESVRFPLVNGSYHQTDAFSKHQVSNLKIYPVYPNTKMQIPTGSDIHNRAQRVRRSAQCACTLEKFSTLVISRDVFHHTTVLALLNAIP
jgi:hypothetical protein